MANICAITIVDNRAIFIFVMFKTMIKTFIGPMRISLNLHLQKYVWNYCFKLYFYTNYMVILELK